MLYNEDKENLDKDRLLEDDLFISDARRFLAERKGAGLEDLLDRENVYDQFMSHFRSQNVNEATAIRDMIHAQNANDEGKQRMGRLMDAFDHMDSDFGGKAVGDYAAGIFTAPSTYAGMLTFGAGKAGAVAANQGIKLGLRQVLKEAMVKSAKDRGAKTVTVAGIKGSGKRQVIADGVVQRATMAQRAKAMSDTALMKGGLRAGLGAAGLEGAVGGGAVLAQEETRKETGIKEGVDLGNVVIGAAAGAIPGGLLGTVAGTKKFSTHYEATKELINSRNKMMKGVEDVYNKATVNVLKGKGKGGKVKKAAAQKYVDLLSLEETIPEQLKRGRIRKKALVETDAETLATFDEKVRYNIAAAAAEIVATVPPRSATIKAGSKEDLQERFSSRLVRGMTDPNVLSEDKLIDILNKYGIGQEDLAAVGFADGAGELIAEGVSEAGRLLGSFGLAVKRRNRALFKAMDELDQSLKKEGEYKSSAALQEMKKKTGTLNAGSNQQGFLSQLTSARVGLMTVNVATTVRNTTSGYLRNYIYALDNLGSGVSNIVLAKTGLGQAMTKKAVADVTEEQLKDEAERAVKLGTAQLRVGFQSLFLKDLFFLSQSKDALVLRELMTDDVFGKSDIGRKLFRDLGDMGEHLNSESGLLRLARVGNTLNKMSDDMFKNAIFARELEKELAVSSLAAQKGTLKETVGMGIPAGQIANPNLRNMIEQDRFSSVPDEMIGRAMNKALSFTYQRGDWDRSTLWGSLANTVIKFGQSPLGSLVVPFPKYMVNQFKTAYEYAPVLGLADFGTGILDKADVNASIINRAADKMGKQMAGLATLGAFVMARKQFGDEKTEAFEYNDPTSAQIVNAEAAIGPFSTFALSADLIYKVQNDIPLDGFVRNLSKALTGGQFRPNTGLDSLDRMISTIGSEDMANPEKVKRTAAEAAGNFLNGFLVGAGMLKDVMATIDPDYRVIPNNERVNAFDHMISVGLKSLPQEIREDEERRQSPTKSNGLRYASPILRQVTGFSFREANNVAENEFDRLRIPYRKIAPTEIKFDPELSNEARGIMGQFVTREIARYINSPDYQSLKTDEEKRYLLQRELNYFRAEANNRVLNQNKYLEKSEIERISKALFFKLGKEERKYAMSLYEQSTGNKLVDTLDYQHALAILQDKKKRDRASARPRR